jgi:hypothetical protein
VLEEKAIINALNHEVRREMLRMLHEGPLHVLEMQDYQNLPSVALKFHLKQLSGFVEENGDHVVRITALGERTFMLLDSLCRDFSNEEKLLLKIARLVQEYEAELNERAEEVPSRKDPATFLLLGCATLILLAISFQFVMGDALFTKVIIMINLPIFFIALARKCRNGRNNSIHQGSWLNNRNTQVNECEYDQ